MRRGRQEIVTVGANPNLQLVGSDPAGGAYDLGIFIGPNNGVTNRTLRQLFMLVVKTFNAGQRGRVVGFRQYLTMLTYIASQTPGALYPLERPICTPTWKFTDANVLWGIRQIPPKSHFLPNVSNAEGLSFRNAQTPAQLFETVGGGQVTPPYGGMFPGNILTPELGRFTDLRCNDWSEPVDCDLPFEGPCDIAFFASVQQTNPATRTPPPAIACSNPIPVSQQINGNLALPLNSAVEHWIVVTTSGGVGVIGDLYFDNGLNDGNPVAIIPPFTGESIIPSTNFTGGTITLNAGQVYTWGGAGFNPSFPQSQFLTTQGTTPEDAFLQNYPGAVYGRIAGSLIFEMEEQAPTGGPKTYLRASNADRITTDETETGDNELYQSAAVTNKGLSGLPPEVAKSGPIARITRKWWTGLGQTPSAPKKPTIFTPPRPNTGMGTAPKDPSHSNEVIARLTKKYRKGNGDPR
jgi:hypothetical protein